MVHAPSYPTTLADHSHSTAILVCCCTGSPFFSSYLLYPGPHSTPITLKCSAKEFTPPITIRGPGRGKTRCVAYGECQPKVGWWEGEAWCSKAHTHRGGTGCGIPSNLSPSDLFRPGSQMLLLLPLLGANQSYFGWQPLLVLYWSTHKCPDYKPW